ncbi:MAG: hypothetical protein EKK31_10755 [Hyphomicrobiales bacterium]|nr:MAG: hypothetical protein EKK31_10755 [Hyphomicrobiales bacterium]
MNRGLVYLWRPDVALPLGGHVEKGLVDLGRLDLDTDGRPRLRNELVEVRNGGRRYRLDPASGNYEDIAVGDAKPDDYGDFCFEAGKGGGRLDKYPFAPEDFQQRYVQAAHFGEVNTFYHLHRISAYIDGLLRSLGEPSLPPVVAVVNAHHAVTTTNGVKDGLHRGEDLCPAFQGGHYRLPCKRNTVVEHHAIAVDGEIHLGPGRELLDSGALVELAGCSYRANASHNAGIIYHEYGHHICRHTADFMANRLRKPHRQDNRKAAIDEGLCDYWTAAMLETPHIWAFHKRHDDEQRHPRSLASCKTMDDFDPADEADPHLNGTIWGAALWDLRCEMQRRKVYGAYMTDRMVLKALTLISADCTAGPDVKVARRQRSDYSGGLAKLLKADAILFDGRFGELIGETFARRKIFVAQRASSDAVNTPTIVLPDCLSRLPADEIPSSTDILSGSDLARQLDERGVGEYSVICTGDIMLGDRTRRPIKLFGEDYPFAGLLPLLRRSSIVCGNLEGPFAREADRQDRTYSYRVDPRLAHALKRANINVVTLANNHLVDCGRTGVLETFEALDNAGVHMIGAGRNELAAHEPIILDAGPLRVGILGYYWNRRCAATRDLPGSATDEAEWLTVDIQSLRHRVDRIVTVFHWGVPYVRTPHPDDQAKARLAVDLGADLVIGHHPHVIQPFEIYKGSPIFYSVGNFTFGSGNSKAEGLLVAAHFGDRETVCDIYPIYVKNRDPRVDYQPKTLGGAAGRNILQRLADMSGPSGTHLELSSGPGRLRVARPAFEEAAR